MNEIQEKAYARYQMHWMFSHSITMQDVYTAAENAQDDDQQFEEWIECHGFGGGSLWVCPDEFLDAEYQDKAYMRELLSNSEYISYLEDTGAMSGYLVVDFNGTGMLEIQRDDSKPICTNDFAAVSLAMQDGIEIIPVEELPENFDRRYLGWIDTPENRSKIKAYCAGLQPRTQSQRITAAVAFDRNMLDNLEQFSGTTIRCPEELRTAIMDAINYAVQVHASRPSRNPKKHDHLR